MRRPVILLLAECLVKFGLSRDFWLNCSTSAGKLADRARDIDNVAVYVGQE